MMTIRRRTWFNTSRPHLAELIIRENMQHLADIWTAMKKYENASPYVMEMAKEFADFEEDLIEEMKGYL